MSTNKIQLFFLLIICIVLQSCATTYQKNSIWSYSGGFSEQKGPGKLVKITFTGNNFVSQETIRAYTLYRCAEYTKEQGATHFIAYKNLTMASLDRKAEGVGMGTVGGKPIGVMYILLRDNAGPGTWHADTILKNYHDIVHPVQQESES